MTDYSQDHNGAPARLRSLVERFERLQSEVDNIRSDQKEILTEVSSAGFDKTVFREMLRLRKKYDSVQLELFESTRDTYLAALGMLGVFEPETQAAPAPPARDPDEPTEVEDVEYISAPPLQIEAR